MIDQKGGARAGAQGWIGSGPLAAWLFDAIRLFRGTNRPSMVMMAPHVMSV